MRRLSFVWRMALIVIAALVTIQLIAAAAYYVQRGRATESGFRLPLPDQIAALIELLDSATPEQRTMALRIANGAGLRVSIKSDPPPEANPPERAEWIEHAVGRYLRAGRQIHAYYIGAPRGGDGRRPALEMFSRRPVRVVAPLQSGGVVVAETVDELTVRVLGLPPGFWAGILGFAVAALALYGVVRETRPLSRLACSIESFGEAMEPAPVPERGAREMRALIAAVNAMQSRIATLVKSRTFMLGAISHDLRTYLTRLRLRVEMLPEPDARQRAVRDVEDMEALLEDTLIFARTSFARSVDESVDLIDIVRREVAERQSAGASVQVEPLPAQAIVVGETSALARVVGNLIDNAIKYGGEARVVVKSGPDATDLLVEDRGPGVPEAERERIFEPFLRLESSRNRERGGAGLGLAIARHLVESFGGAITVENRQGGGASFRVRLRPASRT